ncbi:MAG: DUF2079 domain-containing protein [Chloroflexia bacterium]
MEPEEPGHQGFPVDPARGGVSQYAIQFHCFTRSSATFARAHCCGRKKISLIPPDAPVSAYSELLSHLSHRRYLYYFPQGVREPRNPSPEYVCADTWTERPWEKETIRAMLAGHRWKVVAEEQGYILFRRASSPP